MTSSELLQEKTSVIRANCIMMAYNGKSSHLSSALSSADILTTLYGRIMTVKHDSDNHFADRDRFIMSKGHGVSALYAVMAEFGLITKNELKTYCKTDSRLQNHPCRNAFPLLECSSGSLGYGIGIATGMLIGCRLRENLQSRTYVLVGDGETNEGSIWEAAMFATAQKLGNLVVIVDNNNTQAVGKNDKLTGYTSIANKFMSFGWRILECDGNDIDALLATIESIPHNTDIPSAIIAKTTSGFGVSFMEKNQVWFYRTPSIEDVIAAFVELKLPCDIGEML